MIKIKQLLHWNFCIEIIYKLLDLLDGTLITNFETESNVVSSNATASKGRKMHDHREKNYRSELERLALQFTKVGVIARKQGETI